MREVTIKPALFVDFDGTVRGTKSGKNFIRTAELEDICLLPNTENVLNEWKEKGYILIGVTNQGGVAYGFKTEQEVESELGYTLSLFKENPFFRVIYSPYHPDGKIPPYNRKSLNRKPDYGMLVVAEYVLSQAENTYFDWENSILVGDRDEDEQCAKNAGILFIHADDFFKRR